MKRDTRRRLTLEPLETRTLLSTCNVTRLGDFGAGATLGEFSRGDLRYCITHANANPGLDTIRLEANGAIKLNSALPAIVDDLSIDGPGSGMLTIDAQQNARVLHIEDSVSVEVSGVTLTHGYANNGAGIYNEGSLVLRESSIVGNVVPAQGGVGGGIYNEGTLWLWSCTVSENISESPFGGGGGIANDGSLFIHSSIIQNNRAANEGFSSITRGGGIRNYGQATIINSTISSNVVGGGFISLGGGVHSEGGELTVIGTLISNNTAAAENGVGGGIYATSGGTFTLINSTVSHNSALNLGEFGWGGGIYTSSVDATISHSTIVENFAANRGGGLTVAPSISLEHSIVANNDSPEGPDLYGNFTSLGYNLIGTSTGGSGYAPTDVLNIDPMLGPLQHNGGPTQTHALLPGSPAIDAGNPNPEDPPEWDQRGPGFPRVVNGRIDIGAFEVQASGAPLPADYLAALVTADLESVGRI